MSNPLDEAKPQSLDAIFSMDPLELQDNDISVVVAELRRQRQVWLTAEAGGKTRAPKAAAPTNLSLGDLEL